MPSLAKRPADELLTLRQAVERVTLGLEPLEQSAPRQD
jgi:hypothetical protein